MKTVMLMIAYAAILIFVWHALGPRPAKPQPTDAQIEAEVKAMSNAELHAACMRGAYGN